MKSTFFTSLAALAAVLCLSPSADGQPQAPRTSVPSINDLTILPVPPGVTRLSLIKDVSNGTIAPESPSRVRVPPLERVYLFAPNDWPSTIQWTKDGRPIEGATSSPLLLELVTFADAGVYTLASTAPHPFISSSVRLDVAAESQFGNLSARIKLSPGEDIQIVGYVVNGRAPKRLLLRTVGPTLAKFGVGNPAPEPRFRLYKADGTPFSIPRPAVMPAPTYWNSIFTQAGAFPLTGGEAAFVSYDAYDLPPGTYTLHVSDDARQGGEVLVEIYEFEFYPPFFP